MQLGSFINLKKGLDTIDRDRWIDKGERCGISRLVLTRLRSSLDNRQQSEVGWGHAVLFGQCLWSPPGVSVGATSLHTDINDTCQTATLGKFVLFPDDTNMFVDLQQILMLITSEMRKLKRCFDRNQRSFQWSTTNSWTPTTGSYNL